MAHADPRTKRSRDRRGLLLFASPLIAFLLLRMLASLTPGQGWWGLDFGGYLPAWQFILLTAFALLTAVLATVPDIAVVISRQVKRAGELVFPARPSAMLVRHVIIALTFGLLAFLTTMPFPFLGGDGVHVIRRLYRFNTDVLSAYGQLNTEPLTVLLYAGIAKLTGAGSSATGSVDLTGYTLLFRIVAGVGAALLAWIVLRHARHLAEGGTERLALTCMSLGTSGTLLFLGYVEFYVPVFTAGALFLFSGMRCVKENSSPFLPGLALLLAIGFHFSAVAFIPALLYLLVRNANIGGEGRGARISFRLQTTLVIIAVSAAVVVYTAGISGPWIHLTTTDSRSTLFSAVHARDVLNNVLLAAPMALTAFVMLIPVLRRRVGSLPAAPVFAAIACAWWFGLILSQPAFAQDWDIFTLFGLGSACAAVMLLAVFPTRERRAYIATQMTVQPLLFLLPWLLLHLNQDAAVTRYSDLTEMYSGVLPSAVVAGFHETLRSEAAGRSSGLEEIRRIEKMIVLTDDSYEYMKLLRALSNGDPGTSGALPEMRRILAHLRRQPDSILDHSVGEDAVSRSLTLRGLYPSLVTSMGKVLTPEGRISWLAECVASARLLGQAFPILAQLGNIAYAVGEYPKADRWYTLAAADSLASPADGGATLSHIYSQLGIIRFNAGSGAAALSSFRHATMYRSVPSSAWSNLGFALFRSGRFVESAGAFRTTLRMDSSDINALYCLGRLSLLRPESAATGRWLLGRFLLREPRGARSRDAARLLASMVPSR